MGGLTEDQQRALGRALGVTAAPVGPTREAARRAALERALGAAPAPDATPNIPPGAAGPIPAGARLLGTFGDGGRVYETPDGRRGAVSAGGSTTDPATVERIMAGGTFAEAGQDRLDAERIAATPVASRGLEFVRGVPFVGSYTDEAIGLVSPQAAENMRASTEAMQRQNPNETMALNIGGGIVGAIPMALAAAPAAGNALAGAPMWARFAGGVGAGAVTGATEGAIYGAGEAGGAGRGANALEGAQWGGAFGAGIGGAGAILSPILRNAIGRAQGSDVATVATQMGISRPAARIVRDAIRAGGATESRAALQAAGPNAMLADAGVPARQLLDAAAQSGGEAAAITRRAIGERTREETAGMTEALDRILGRPQGEQEIVTSIRRGTQPARSEAYATAYATPIDYSADAGRTIETLLDRVPASAWRQATEIMRREGVESAQRLVQIADDGTVTLSRMPDVRELHYIMQGLDDVVEAENGAGRLGGQTTLGRATAGLRSALSGALERAVPEFATAQRTAASAIRRREAVDLGYSLLRTGTTREEVAEGVARMPGPAGAGAPPDPNLPAAVPGVTEMTPLDAARIVSPADLGQALQRMPASERAAARQGVRAYIDDTMASVARTITDPDTSTREGIRLLRDMSSRANRTKLRILLGERDATALLSRVDEAATAFELRAAVAENSKTAVRQSIQSGVQQIAEGGIVRSLMRGQPIDATRTITQALTGETAEATQLRAMGLYSEIAQALTGIRGPQAQRAMTIIERAINGQPLSDAQAEFIATTLVLPPVIASERLSLPAR